MNTYSTYNLETGLFDGRSYQLLPEHLALNVPDGYGCILGVCPPERYMVDLQTGLVVKRRPADLGPEYSWDEATLRWVRPPTLAEVKDEVRAALEFQFDFCILRARTDYPEAEAQTWPRQESEATAVLADPEAPAPLLRALAAARSLDVIEMAEKTLAKADAHAAVIGDLLGRRRVYIERLEQATTVAAAKAVIWQHNPEELKVESGQPTPDETA